MSLRPATLLLRLYLKNKQATTKHSREPGMKKRQVVLYELDVSLFYTASSRPTKATERDAVSK